MKPTRRESLRAMAVLPVLGQDHSTHVASPALPSRSYTPKVFAPADLQLLAELTDRIIPRTETPGAADAGVPLLIDRTASGHPELATRWKDLLAWFRQAGPTPEERLMVLQRISTETDSTGARHFALLKGATCDHYYSTQQGLQQELGWNANTYVAEFTGCTHPEHKD